MRPIDIQPAGLIRTTEKVAPIGPVRPATTVANGEKDVEVVRRSFINSQEPPVDGQRVEQIRQAIADGSYSLAPAEIADAMIATNLTMRNSK